MNLKRGGGDGGDVDGIGGVEAGEVDSVLPVVPLVGHQLLLKHQRVEFKSLQDSIKGSDPSNLEPMTPEQLGGQVGRLRLRTGPRRLHHTLQDHNDLQRQKKPSTQKLDVVDDLQTPAEIQYE